MKRATVKPLEPGQCEELRARLDRDGLERTVADSGINRGTLERASWGAPVTKGTRVLIVQWLDRTEPKTVPLRKRA